MSIQRKDWADFTSEELSMENLSKVDEDTQLTSRGRNQLTRCVEFIENHGIAGFLCTENHECFVRFPIAGAWETAEVDSPTFTSWLVGEVWEKCGFVPSDTTVKAIQKILQAKAQKQPSQNVFLRTGEVDGKYYLALMDQERHVVEVSTDGIRPLGPDENTMLFRRPTGSGALPEPQEPDRKEDITKAFEEFRRLLGLPMEEFAIAISWVLAAFHPHGPYPVLILSGEQNSGKSTATRMLCRLIDPVEGDFVEFTDVRRDFLTALYNRKIVAVDNLSGLPNKNADLICKIASGNSSSFRTLYMNRQVTTLVIKRPILLNGIPDFGERADLLSRSLLLRLPKRENSLSEEDLYSRFDAMRPRLLWSCLACVWGTMQGEVEKPPHRMVDALKVAVAGTDWGFLPFTKEFLFKVLKNQAIEQDARIIDNDPVASAVLALLAHRGEWEGTATELLEVLRDYVPHGMGALPVYISLVQCIHSGPVVQLSRCKLSMRHAPN